jgi:putative copper export protein
MGNDLLSIIHAAFDILALFIYIGALACHLWVILPIGGVLYSPVTEALRIRLWHLRAAGVAALTISSFMGLLIHAIDMSDRRISTIFSVLPVIILQTHYEHLWVARPVALAALWMGWEIGRRRLDSCAIPVFMLSAGAVIGMSRSASGHAADWGDQPLPVLMDWLHLLSASVWGGGLIALSIVVLPKIIGLHEQQ